MVGTEPQLEMSINYSYCLRMSRGQFVSFYLDTYFIDAMSKGPTGTLKGRRTEILKGVWERAVFSTAKGGGNVCLERSKQNAFGRVHLSAFVSPFRVNARKFCQFQMPPGRLTPS